MRKLLVSPLCLLSLAAAAFDTSPWQYRSRIQPNDDPASIAVVRLAPEVYVRARRDLADLRIVRGGEEVPYLIETLRGSVEDHELEPAILNKSIAPARGLQITLDLGGHLKHSRLRISTSETDFRQKVRIETGDDNRRWATARDDGYIFDFSKGDRHVAMLSVDYPVSTRRYVRATIFGWTRIAALGRAWLAYHHEQGAERDVVATVAPERTEDVRTKSSLLLLDLKQAGLPHDRVRLESRDAPFYRAVELEASSDQKNWQYVTSGTVYQIEGESSLSLPFSERHDRYMRLRIFNGDDRPVQVSRVFVEAPARLLRFPMSRGAGDSWLYFGNPDAKPPAYDFAALLARQAPRPEARASLSPIAANPGYRPPPAPVPPWSERHPQLLYATLALAVLVMGYVTVRFLMKVTRAQ
jgi:hypothetical protein